MAPSHLLLIEDDADIVDFLQADLEDAGYRVTSAFSVYKGLLLHREARPDLIITDLGLPDGDGREIVRQLRTYSDVPIIVLTARDDVSERVALLEAGADDYVLKPFVTEELLARIALRLRDPLDPRLRVGPLELDRSQQTASVAGQPLDLLPGEFELLSLLTEQPGRLYTRDEIGQRVGGHPVSAQGHPVDLLVADLRAKFRRRGVYALFRSVPGVGYALRAEPAAAASLDGIL